MRIFELAACPGCHGTESTPLVYGNAELRRCSRCSLVHSAHYDDPDEVYVDGYLTADAGYGLDVLGDRFQRYLRHCADIRLDRLDAVVGEARGTLLDVGCGTGEVLAAARDRGWVVQGVEPVADSAAHAVSARGLDVRTSLLESSGLPERSYDVVSAFHVLEHMTDGEAFLRLLARWARPGGHVVVEVPNWRSAHRRGSADWLHLRPREHLAHHTPSTLRATVERAGLAPVSISTPGFVWSGQTVAQQLADLGLARFARLAIGPFGRPGSTANRAAVAAVQGAYDRAKVGMVLLAIARTS